MDLEFIRLTQPTIEIARHFEKWENDPAVRSFIHPHKDQRELEQRKTISLLDLEHRLEHNRIYLIYMRGRLIGEMDYQVDPPYLYKQETGTAWIGIVIGEEAGRGKGIGGPALHYLEEQIRQQQLRRIELGVFEFNTPAIRLYQKLGYREFAKIEDFTYWQGRMWQDIRMEKLLEREVENNT